MSALLEMPVRYTTILDDEFDDIDGGAVPVLAIIAAAVAAGGTIYGIGQVAGERAYYAGLRNAEYQDVKWNVRAGVIGIVGLVPGGILLTGFENKFYSMI